jgi:hypothetical protein
MGIFRRRSDQGGDRDAAVEGFEILELKAAELAWVNEMRRSLPGDGLLGPGAIGGLYDDALIAWLTAPANARDDPSAMISVLGVAIGDLVCLRVASARWVTFVNPNGTELAVVAGPPDGPVIFPIKTVARRWSAAERGWIPGFVESAVKSLVEPG